jgi:hypothetical protein
MYSSFIVDSPKDSGIIAFSKLLLTAEVAPLLNAHYRSCAVMQLSCSCYCHPLLCDRQDALLTAGFAFLHVLGPGVFVAKLLYKISDLCSHSNFIRKFKLRDYQHLERVR